MNARYKLVEAATTFLELAKQCEASAQRNTGDARVALIAAARTWCAAAEYLLKE